MRRRCSGVSRYEWEAMRNLEEIRTEIDSVDREMAALFERRMKCSGEVARYKSERGLSVCDASREAEVIRRNSALVGDESLREYYVLFQNGLMGISRNYQTRIMQSVKVAYSGVPGAFAHTAAVRMFPGADYRSYRDFASAYAACCDGECDVAVLPFENSSAGEVSAVSDLMFAGSLYVNQVLELEAVQNLLGVPGASKEEVKEVVSHPQALSQCAGYIHGRGLSSRECSNTALAARSVAEGADRSVAAIGSEEAARLYGLEVLERHINTSGNNTTRFAALSRVMKRDASAGRMGRRFILMFTVRNEAGSLAKTLNIIGAHGYNMSNLHSRPMKELLWNYYFFVELDGDVFNDEGENMMRELGTICDRLKLLGSFNIVD